MNIGFDLDGVLYPWQRAVYNMLVVDGKISGESFSEFFSKGRRMFQEDQWEYWASIETLYDKFIPSKSDMAVLNLVNSLGHSIFYITNRWSDPVKRVTEKYLSKYKFPQNNNLVFSRNKRDDVSFLEIDLMIEDRYYNMKNLAGVCKILGMSRPWNWEDQDYLEGLGVTFITDLNQVLGYL